MKKLLLIFGLALLMAAIFSALAKPVPIEQKLIRIHASDVLEDYPGIEQEPIEIQAILLDMSEDPLLLLKAKAALIRYPDMVRSLFPVYASQPEFQDILKHYGESILPPIQHFVSQPITSIEWMNKAAGQYQAAKRFFTGAPDPEGPDANEREALSPEERGWYAVNFILNEGHDFLGQFAVDDQGVTQWVRTERVLESVNQFFAGGIRDLERNYRSGDKISAGNVGWASVDVLVFASAAKVLRIGRTAAITTKGAGRSARSTALAARVSRSGKMVLNSARYAKWPVILGAGYLIVSHPSIISDLFAGIADVLDYPVIAVQFVGWLLILVPALYVGNWLLWLATPLLTALLRAVSYLLTVLSGRNRRNAEYEIQ